MKTLLRLTAVLAIASFAFSSCNCFKQMAKHQDEVSVTCTPEVLVLNNGKVAADITVKFPEQYFNKKAVIKVTPVLVFAEGEVAAPAKFVQGEKVKENYTVVTKTGGTVTQHVEFAYDERMQKSELQLRVEVKCPKGPCKEFTLVNAKDGAVPTKAQAEALEKGGAEADAIKRAFGLTIARGVNTLQETLDFGEVMQNSANNYQYVKTYVTKADIAYKINSSTVDKKAVRGEDMEALEHTVRLNQLNDRAKQTVFVNGYASPDGPEKFNDKLSNARSLSGQKAVEKILADAGINIDAAAYGEDWEGFKEAVAASDIADKGLILQVLNMYDSSAQRETEIKNMSSVYKALKDEVLPKLRRAQVVNTADIAGKTDEEIAELVKDGNFHKLDVEELLHIAEVCPEVAEKALVYAAAKYNDPRAYNNLGKFYAQNKEYAKALAAFESAVKAGGNSAEINNNLALAYATVGDTAKAYEYAKAGNAQTQAMVNAAQGDYTAAAKTLTGYNAALAQFMNGNLAAAKSALGNDASAKADYLRAVIAAKEGNISTAKTQLASAIAKEPALENKAKNDINLTALF